MLVFCESCDILINRKRELRRSEAIKTNDTHMKFVDAKMKREKTATRHNNEKCKQMCYDVDEDGVRYRARAYYFVAIYSARRPDRRFSLRELLA